jgi:hypothetical protein
MSTYQLLLNGSPADDDLYAAISSLEVEENADLPDAIQLDLPVNQTEEGDLTFVGDERFGPFANVAVVVQPDGGGQHCIFDGYVLSQMLHLETGTTASTLRVWGQDSSWLMNLEEKIREWVDVTDADVANDIFGDYGFDPAPGNSSHDSPAHTEDGHSLRHRHPVPALVGPAQRQALSRGMHRPGRAAHRLFRQAGPRRRSGGHARLERPGAAHGGRARYRVGRDPPL